jgi:sulfoxide reductase heme-binding subunit YedZ
VTQNDLWFTARGAGLAALLSLTITVVIGTLGSAAVTSAPNRVVWQYVHRTAAGVGILLVAVHVTTLVFDAKAHVGVAGAFVPFASQYRPNAVALGSITAYTIIVVAVAGAARGRFAATRVGAASWRGIHVLAYPAWLTAVLHSVLSGTDRAVSWVVLLDVSCVGAVMIAGVMRLVRADATLERGPDVPRLMGPVR